MWHILDSQVPEPFRSLKRVMSLEGELISQAKNRDVIKVIHQGKAYYIKRYTVAGKGLRAYFGRSRVRAEWENLQYFWHMRVPAPKLLAYGEEKDIFTGYRSGAYVMHAIPNVAPLNAIEQYPELLDEKAWRVQLLTQIAQYLRVLHNDGFCHGDLYWRNILFALKELPSVYFIDCPQGSHFLGPRLSYQKVRDLACLAKGCLPYFSKSDLMRFFKVYRGTGKLRPEDKSLIRKVFERLKEAGETSLNL